LIDFYIVAEAKELESARIDAMVNHYKELLPERIKVAKKI